MSHKADKGSGLYGFVFCDKLRHLYLSTKNKKGLLKNKFFNSPFLDGADYGDRTRHLDLGKVALYQMS